MQPDPAAPGISVASDGSPLATLDVGPHQLLDAMEGVAYLTAPDGTILALGHPGWSLFAADNGAPWLSAEALIGTSLFASIRGVPVQDAYRRMHQSVVSGRRPRISFEFRCDSPIAERHMRMAITPVIGGEQVTAVLYQSQIVAERTRMPVPLFDWRNAPEPAADPSRVVLMCSFCQLVRWPVGSDSGRRRWIGAAEYYRAGGPENPTIQSVVCPRCERHVVAPNSAAP